MKKIIMIILDGFGIRNDKKGNAVRLATTPVLDKLYAEFPHASLKASGTEVGLPKGQMGNSEVGHITIGSGRIVKQPLVLLNEEIKSKKIFENDVLLDVIEHVKKEAKQRGCYEVTLNVWTGNTSAEKFYEKMGMRTKERQMEYIL